MIRLSDAEDIDRNTYCSNRAAASQQEAVEDWRADQEHDARKLRSECKTCYYLRGGVAGQAFTRWTCILCGDERQHHNTMTPRVCEPCAKLAKVCVLCGGDVDLKAKRKNRKMPTPKAVQHDA